MAARTCRMAPGRIVHTPDMLVEFPIDFRFSPQPLYSLPAADFNRRRQRPVMRLITGENSKRYTGHLAQNRQKPALTPDALPDVGWGRRV